MSRARDIALADLVNEVEHDDAEIALGSKLALLLRDPEHGRAMLDVTLEECKAHGFSSKEAYWKSKGFPTERHLLVAYHASKPKSSVPMGLVASFNRFEVRQSRREVVDQGVIAASSVVLPAPALRSTEQEALAPSVELGIGAKK